MFIAERKPAVRVLRYAGLNRSTYYNRLRAAERPRNRGGGRPVPGCSWTAGGSRILDDEVKGYLDALVRGDGVYYGYLKLTHALRREYRLVINKKKVYRLCKEMEVLRPQRRIQARQPRKLARNRVITESNQLWETDVKYGYIAGEDRFFYVVSLLDVFDRAIVGYRAGLECDARSVLRVLKDALAKRGCSGKGLVVRSDNGPQFKSKVLRAGCAKLGVEQEYIPAKTPNLNAHIESYHSILEAECLSGGFESYYEALTELRGFVDFYNERRLHSGCGYRPPMEYYLAAQNGYLGRPPVRV